MANLRGIYSIATSPFDQMGGFVWDDFEREIDWIVRAGAHGLVQPVMASEFTVLSTRERVRAMKLCVDIVAGRIPVVIGVADTSKDGAVYLAEQAAAAGADAVIAMPPWATHMNRNELFEDYYRAIAATVNPKPVIIQNCGPPLGSSLPGAFVVELCAKIENVSYLKEEKPPQGRAISEVMALAGPEVHGVFSGAGCKWLFTEYKRGVCGNMPASPLSDIDAQIWDLLEEGEEAKAREIHNTRLVLENALTSMPHRAARKYLMVRRGVFTSAGGRNQLDELDDIDRSEFDYAYGLLEPHFTV